MKKILFIAIAWAFCLNSTIYAQSARTPRNWSKMSFKEKTKYNDGLEKKILALQDSISILRTDSVSMVEQVFKLDSEFNSNKKFYDKASLTVNNNQVQKKKLGQEIESYNSELSDLSKYDNYIIAYAKDKLRYPWNSSVNSAIAAIDSLKDEKLRAKYAETRTLLKGYEQLYSEVISVIEEAQRDPTRLDTTLVMNYKERTVSLIDHTKYEENYKGRIPFLEILIKEFRSRLNRHSREQPADFQVLLHYDAIEKM